MKRIYACIAIVGVLLSVAFYSSWKVQSFADVISADLDAAAEAIRNADHPAARQALADGAGGLAVHSDGRFEDTLNQESHQSSLAVAAPSCRAA